MERCGSSCFRRWRSRRPQAVRRTVRAGVLAARRIDDRQVNPEFVQACRWLRQSRFCRRVRHAVLVLGAACHHKCPAPDTRETGRGRKPGLHRGGAWSLCLRGETCRHGWIHRSRPGCRASQSARTAPITASAMRAARGGPATASGRTASAATDAVSRSWASLWWSRHR
jgi:hypothetical protein